MILFSEITKKQSACGFMVVNAVWALFLTNRTSYKEREISTFSHSLGHGGCNKLISFTWIKKTFEYKKQRLSFCCLFSLIVKNLWFQGNCSQAGKSTKNWYQYSFIVTFCDFPCGLACCSWGGTGHLLIGKLAVLSQRAPGSPCLIILGQDTEPCCFPMHSSEYECVDDRKKCLWGMLYKVL